MKKVSGVVLLSICGFVVACSDPGSPAGEERDGLATGGAGVPTEGLGAAPSMGTGATSNLGSGGADVVAGTGSAAATGGGPGVVVPPDFPEVPPDEVCGAGVTPLGLGRCGESKVVAAGTALVLHNFEDAGEKGDHLAAFFADKRAGEWWEAHFPDNGAAATLAVQPGPGASSSSAYALHFSGTAPGGWGATAGIAISDCYDASAYSGIGFRIKGNAAAGNSWIKFSVHTPVSEPEPAGGCSAADEAAGKCRDHFAAQVPLTDSWVRHNLTWADLGQKCPSNIQAGYVPGSQIITLSFSIMDREAGYDFWIDDLSFDVGTEPASGFANIVSRQTFEELWRTENGSGQVTDLRNAFYTYDGLVAATAGFAGFCSSGDATQNRREAAAFLANIAHESDSLGLVRETKCQTGSCEYGNYYGRGPIQLTWQGNYQAAGSALGRDLVGSPDLVATDATIAFGTALWFWNTSTGAGSQTPHAAIQAGSFRGTIQAINGALECGGGNSTAVQNRIEHYLRFCQFLGVDPGVDLSC